MEFKAGDRVHVTRLEWEDVDFYGTLNKCKSNKSIFYLTKCTNKTYEYKRIVKHHIISYGAARRDYYILATDEEDTEEPVIQRTTDTHNPVNKTSHYMLGDIEVKDIIAIVADKYHKGSVAHNVASALEYQMRAPEKNGLEDIKKARKCLDFAIENWE
ncbi:DUF3310 domain-containing protein [Mammaliicoccus sciuri]|uniref:DUF3310 domain-containing protein n=1 Tax=Mammaliicoccus sciuri TaxID=1296 RepID=UPI001951F2AC|nr:DUF3310 domain-containing protein [Mammaliicoccus sciuri]